MLFPVLHSVLLWWTGCLIECHGAFLAMALPFPMVANKKLYHNHTESKTGYQLTPRSPTFRI